MRWSGGLVLGFGVLEVFEKKKSLPRFFFAVFDVFFAAL